MKRLAILAIVTCAMLSDRGNGQSVIATVAGTDFTFPLNVTVALNAPLGGVQRVAPDSQGNIYVADSSNNRVFRVGADGAIRVVAGNGIHGFSGDGGQAASASLNGPTGLAADTSGNLFIADGGNARIRKVSASGIITTVAGNGTSGFSSGDGGPATSATLYAPSGVAVDVSGNLFIADTDNNRIRKVSASGIISTVAGNGSYGFSGDGGSATSASFKQPYGVTVDASGNLFTADYGNNRVRKISANGIITTFAGGGSAGDGGQATLASLSVPLDVAVDASGNLFIADAQDNRIRKVSAASGIITTVAGNGNQSFSGDGGPATAAAIFFPYGVGADASGNFFIADTYNGRIRKVSASGTITTVAGNGGFNYSGDGGPASSASLNGAFGITVDAFGDLFIGDSSNYRVRKVSASGVIATVAGNGKASFSGDGGPAVLASLNNLYGGGVAVDASGNLFIADTFNAAIRKVSNSGVITTVPGLSLYAPYDVVVDASGNLFVADTGNNRIQKVSASGTVTIIAGNGTASFSGDGGPAASASLNGPQGVAVDASGNLFVADSANNRIRKVSASGLISTIAGNSTAGFSGDGGPATSASLNGATGIAVGAGGNLFIADRNNHRIREVSAGGIITTVAGNGNPSFSGDGGLATSASLNTPQGVAVDANGNLFIADSNNSRIREVLAQAPTLTVSPASFSLSLTAGGSSSQQISLASPVAGLAWSATATANWITLTPTSGTTPAAITAAINVASLQPGTYSASIMVSNPLALPSQETVSVSLTVTAATVSLAVAPATLNFQIQQGTPAQTHAVTISSAGGGALNWTAQGDSVNPWISVSPSSGSASVAGNSSLQVSISSAGLSPGVHNGTITISSPTTSTSTTVAVNLLVTPGTPTILLTQTALTFTGIENGGVVPAQTFGVLNTGGGRMNWTAIVGSPMPWLTLASSSGTSVANSANPPMVQVNADATGMIAGKYVGQIQVFASGASNTPQIVTVLLNVLPKGSPLPPVIQPTSLIFVRQAGTSSPGSQTIFVSTAKPETASATPSVAANSPFPVTLRPTNFAYSPSQPNQFIVQPTLGSLAPGQYTTKVTIQSADSSGLSNQTVTVLFVVTAGPTSSSEPAGAVRAQLRESPADVNCPTSSLTVGVQAIGGATVGAAQRIQAKVIDNCNVLTDGANVKAEFQYSDSPLILAQTANGIYEASWSPLKAGPQSVSVTATSGNVTGNTTSSVVGTVGGQTQARTTFTNAASFAANGALSPGSLISVFGQNLASSTPASATLPIPTLLGGAQLNIGGQNVPLLYTSSGQVNAQIPLTISPNSGTSAYFLVNQGFLVGQQSIVGQQNLLIARASPGVFATDANHQGAITDANGAILNGSNPANRGQVVIIYATGLGPVDTPPALGAPASSSPPANTLDAPSVTIGGLPATVQFSGLAPGFVGLYQINVMVPQNVVPGSAVPVVVTQAGFASNSVTMAVR